MANSAKQNRKKVMSDVHVLDCRDFYPKSALRDMWVKCLRCTGWSQ